MPYAKNTDLPAAITDHLPKAAQTVFRKIVNAATKQYGDDPKKTFAVAYAGLKKAGWEQDKDGTWHRIKESEPLQEAVGDPSTGVMIALYPEATLAEAMALPDGEAAEELHLTAAYLGRMADLEPDVLAQLPHIVECFAVYAGQLDGTVNGIGRFMATETSDGQDTFYASVDCPELPHWRHELEEHLEDCGLDLNKRHGFIPHVTLQYLEPGAPLPIQAIEPKPIHFSQVRLVMGTAVWTFDLHGLDELKPDDDESPMVEPSYVAQGPALMYEAYQHLAAVSTEPMASVSHEAMLQAIEALKTELADGVDLDHLQESATSDTAKEALEAVKVWRTRMDEAGQRHSSWEYELFDKVIAMLKELRGQTPSETKAEKTAQAESPEAMMQSGYAGSMTESAPYDLKESTFEIIREASPDGMQWEVAIIGAGISKNRRFYSKDVLTAAAPLFENCRVYTYDRLLKGREIFDHLSEDEVKANPSGYARDLVGFIKDPRMVGSRLMGTLVLLETGAWIGKNAQNALQRGLPMPYGLSIDAEGDGHFVEQAGGEKLLHVDAIRRVRSTDIVTYPAAGGTLLRLVASQHPPEPESAEDTQVMALIESLQRQLKVQAFELVLREALDETTLPTEEKRRIRTNVLAALP